MIEGRRLEIRGTVQGVGFRPWVLRTARRFEVAGRVFNDSRGVVVEVFAEPERLARFIQCLQQDRCPGADVMELRDSPLRDDAPDGFSIDHSVSSGNTAFSIPPDLATCPECERELSDPADRRYRYAFTNCTQCGPRFTIAQQIPYDRAKTTMRGFTMCVDCRREFDDVEDRRFHAQPNACPKCGPSLVLELVDQSVVDGDPIEGAARLLNDGAIVAIKGLGGFHLACDATSPSAILRLRKRKRRDAKPFAVMFRSIDEAEREVELDERERELLGSRERPIVLVRRKAGGDVAAEVAQGVDLLGVFVPYTPLHRLLLDACRGPLVMTSANPSDEPICKDDDEARRRLSGITDALLLHDRPIAMRCDDSVARVIDGVPTLLRRSRGFVPRPILLSRPVERPVLACGAHLKNTFCIAVSDTAYFGPHVGDLETLAAYEFFEEAVDRLEAILEVRPEVVAYDLHPAYLSTRYALARQDVVHVGVQHHHAHVVSAMAEHGIKDRALGLAFDGTGLGLDGTSAWGGEFLLCFHGGFERLATFRPIRLPGGNVAMREVWRIAYAMLFDAFDGRPPVDSLPLFDAVDEMELSVVRRMLERQLNCPPAHGVGRYFDAFGAIGLTRTTSSYEGQVAMTWDAAACDQGADAYPYALRDHEGLIEIDLRPAVRALVEELDSATVASQISARFHATLVASSTEVTRRLLATHGPAPVALTGGVFQNARLCAGVSRQLRNETDVLQHARVPPGDGGISLGQALIADAVSRDKG
jgi:hydrogenase maturation protein HypF